MHPIVRATMSAALGLALAAAGQASEVEIRFEVLLGRRTLTALPGGGLMPLLAPLGTYEYTPVPIPLDDAGAAQVDALVEELYPRRAWARATLRRVFRILREAEVQDAIRKAVRPSTKERVRFLFNPSDQGTRLEWGEELWVPDVNPNLRRRVFARRGDSVASLAERVVDENLRIQRRVLGWHDRLERITQAEAFIHQQNGMRFQVWPKAGDTESDDEVEAVVQLGEAHGAGKEDVWLRAVLVHEAGHIGHLMTCEDRGDWYGRGRGHAVNEVITPFAAFVEGWANYLALPFEDEDPDAFHHVATQRALFYEPDSETETFLDPQDLRVWDLLANETYVSLLLRELAEEVTHEALEEAFERSFARDCPDALGLLEEFAALHPEVPLEPVLARAFDRRGEEDYARLLAGERPPWYSSTEVPRLRNRDLTWSPWEGSSE